MKLSTQRLLCFVLGSAVTIIFYYTKNESYLSDLRLTKDACEFVGEEHSEPSIVTDAGYWKNNGVECVVFENGRFRSLNQNEQISYEAAWETRAIRD